MPNDSSNHLVAALASLREEEKRLVSQIKFLQARLHEVQAATGPISKLLGEPAAHHVSASDANYSNLTIRAGIARIMQERGVPLTAPEIAKSLLAKGFKSGASNFTNMVGVTLRRLEGKDFKRADDNNWTLV